MSDARADLANTRADLVALVGAEVKKFLAMSRGTPACVADLRELAHLSATVLRLEPLVTGEGEHAQSDFSRLSEDEFLMLGRLLTKARGQSDPHEVIVAPA